MIYLTSWPELLANFLCGGRDFSNRNITSAGSIVKYSYLVDP